MNKADLLETDDFHKANRENWLFLKAAYDGYKALIDLGLLDDFVNASQYKNIGRGYGFNYSRQIIEITTGFIAETPFSQDFSALKNDDAWAMFYSDCDLYGTDYGAWWNDHRDIVACYGYAGILVTQPKGGNPAAVREKGIYPYVTSYSPLDILERRFERDPDTGRPTLSYLKLRQYDPDTVIIWTLEEYQTWDISGDGDDAEMIEEMSGPNQLGEIPFVFHFNLRKPGRKWDGMSLIQDVAPVDASMVRSAIRADSIEHKAAFPMLIMPREEEGTPERMVAIGVSEIQEFDPENPSARPFWLAPEAESAIRPILSIWEKKKSEIYEMSYLQGVMAASQSSAARSGESYNQMFRFLTARLSKMVKAEAEARLSVVRFWLKWRNAENVFSDIAITHSCEFDIEKLVATIDDLMTEKTLLRDSETAQKEISKQIVHNGSLRNIDQDVQSAIFAEIDASNPNEARNAMIDLAKSGAASGDSESEENDDNGDKNELTR